MYRPLSINWGLSYVVVRDVPARNAAYSDAFAIQAAPRHVLSGSLQACSSARLESNDL
jgi:hypothetical protein